MHWLNLTIEAFLGLLAMMPFIIIFQIFENKSSIQIPMSHILGIYPFAFLISGIWSLTGVPSIATINVDFNVNLIPFADIFSNYIQYVQNIVLFIPLGFMLPLLWSKYQNPRKALVCGFLLSLVIELMQLLNFRATDIDDLLMNTLGTGIGYLLFWGGRKLFPKVAEYFCLKVEGQLESDVESEVKGKEEVAADFVVKREAEIYFIIFWFGIIFIQHFLSTFLWGMAL